MSVGIFTCLLQYFFKNRAILVQKLRGEKKLSKTVFGCFKTKKKKKKKVRWPLSSRGGGGKAIRGGIFFAASLMYYHQFMKLVHIEPNKISSIRLFTVLEIFADIQPTLDVMRVFYK